MTGNRGAAVVASASDAALIRSSIARAPGAFPALLARHSPALYRFAFRLTQDADDAREVVHATWLSAWRHLADIRLAGDSMLPWLVATARHRAALANPALQTLELEPIDWSTAEVADAGTDADFTHVSETDWAFAPIARLGDIDRHIVEICIYEGRSYAMAVRMLGLVPQGVGTRLERLGVRLRALRSRYSESEALL